MNSTNFFFVMVILLVTSCHSNEDQPATANQSSINRLSGNDTDGFDQSAIDDLNPVDSNDYRSNAVIDTVFEINNDLFNVSLKTDFDSTKPIIVPKKYVGNYGIDCFRVFESFTMLQIKKNGNIIVDTIISKSNFSEALDSSLSHYGNLMFPKVVLKTNSIKIGHSISIPMTDVGVAVSSTFKVN